MPPRPRSRQNRAGEAPLQPLSKKCFPPRCVCIIRSHQSHRTQTRHGEMLTSLQTSCTCIGIEGRGVRLRLTLVQTLPPLLLRTFPPITAREGKTKHCKRKCCCPHTASHLRRWPQLGDTARNQKLHFGGTNNTVSLRCSGASDNKYFDYDTPKL